MKELDFYLLSDTRKYENKKLTKRKKITFKEVQKKYKAHDMIWYQISLIILHLFQMKKKMKKYKNGLKRKNKWWYKFK